MKKFAFSWILLLFTSQLFGWGATGHRVIGLIAEKHLTKKARKNVRNILGPETLAEVGTYMDFIRSDGQYDHLAPWHYATISGDKYEGPPVEGDVIMAIAQLREELRQKKFTQGEEAFTLKCLIHLVGDLHQPLHVGNGNDRGGNSINVKFFGESSNLHRVWDSDIIDSQQLSYTEYCDWINHAESDQIIGWQSTDVLDWAYESKSYHSQVYQMPEDNQLGYKYIYKNLDLVNLRLLQAGIRLAGIINEIYG